MPNHADWSENEGELAKLYNSLGHEIAPQQVMRRPLYLLYAVCLRAVSHGKNLNIQASSDATNWTF